MTDTDDWINSAPDGFFRKLGWHAISRDSTGRAVGSIAPGFPEEYDEWKKEQIAFGYTVVELQ